MAAASRGAGGDDDDDELARELAAASTGPKSASDPIGLLVQLTALRSRSRSSYIHIKLPALLLLRQFAGLLCEGDAAKAVFLGCGGLAALLAVAGRPLVTPGVQAALESLGSVEEVLYSSSGALYNLSRHPGNRQLLYRLELEVRTRGALADVAADVAARPPRVPEAAEARRRANKDASNMGFGGGGGDGEDEDEEGPYGGDLAGGGASAYGGRGAFVPYYMRHEVERYVSYGSYLQEMLSRPLHAASSVYSAGRSVAGGGAAKSVVFSLNDDGADLDRCGWELDRCGWELDRYRAGSDDGADPGGDAADAAFHAAFPRLSTLRRPGTTTRCEDGDEESYWGGGDSGGESRAGGGFGWVNAAGQEQLRDFQAPRVAMWAAVPGSKISEELYPIYRLESGEPVHIYRRRKDRVDEIRPAGLPQTSAPDATAGSYKHRARGYTLEEEDVPPVAPWRGLGKSVFGGRPKENDSRAFTNRPGIERDIFDKDWLRANAKKRFGQLITKHCPGGTAQAEQVRALVKERYGQLLLIFDYYSVMCAGSADPFSMHLVAWGALMAQCGVCEREGGGRGEGEAGGSAVRPADLDRIFLAANYEEDKASEESKANLDNALMRFEFIEALLRTAVANGGSLATRSAWEPVVDLAGAVRRLLDECIIPRVVPGALVDPDEFREMRLYTQDVDELYDKHAALLKAIYGHYKDLARDSGAAGWLDLPEWLELLGEGRLYHSHFTVREARLAFVWSRMSPTSLHFSVTILATPPPQCTTIHSPTPQLGFRGAHPTYDYYEAVRVDPGLLQPDRGSSGFHAPKSRRLAAKLEQVLEVVVCGLKDLFGANTPEQLIAKLKQPRPRGYKIKKGGG
eukprot:XP_001700653.1 predicted protein [Chlamydomonas reinhardtii]